MPSARFLLAVTALTVAISYCLYIRKCRQNKNLPIISLEPSPKSEQSLQTSHPTAQLDLDSSPIKPLGSKTTSLSSLSPGKTYSQSESPKNIIKPSAKVRFEEIFLNPIVEKAESIISPKLNTQQESVQQPQINTLSTDTSVKEGMAGTFLSGKIRHHSEACSDNVSPKPTTPESSSDSSCIECFPTGYFNDPENDIVEDSPEIICGKPVPKVLIPDDIWQQVADQSIYTESFCIPARMGGVLIGRFGKNVRELRTQWKAEFSLNMSPDNQDLLLFKITCPVEYKTEVLHWVAQRFKMRPSRTTIGNPSQLKRYLPFGVATPVHIRSSYGLKEMFVTVPDEKFARFLEMQQEMDYDYLNFSKQRMQLCEPVTSGTVAVLPHCQGFARALILKVFHLHTVKYALYFLLDHGVFGLIQINELRKIRAKYMRLPFQAIHVSWAHALPMFSDLPELHLLRSYFSSGQIHATAVRMETCCRASVVFTDLMVVSNPSTTASTTPEPLPPAVAQDLQTFPPLNDPQPVLSPQLKMVDILAMCCRAGLYTVAPLVINPSRQCWLNQSDIPYYTYKGGDIDYQSYVSYVLEDGTIKSSPTPVSDKQQMVKASKQTDKRKSRNSKKKPLTCSTKSETSSADEKENRVSSSSAVTPRDSNNNNTATVPEIASNSAWGKPLPASVLKAPEKPVLPARKNPPVKKTAEKQPATKTVVPPTTEPSSPTSTSEEEKPKPKLTLAQIVAMAPTPPPVQKKPVVNAAAVKVNNKKSAGDKKASAPSNSSSNSRRSSGKVGEATNGKGPQRRPLKSRNSKGAAPSAITTSH